MTNASICDLIVQFSYCPELTVMHLMLTRKIFHFPVDIQGLEPDLARL
jgi:hypothetical protein